MFVESVYSALRTQKAAVHGIMRCTVLWHSFTDVYSTVTLLSDLLSGKTVPHRCRRRWWWPVAGFRPMTRQFYDLISPDIAFH